MRKTGVELDEINYAKTGLDEKTVRSIVSAAGGVGAVVNTRHAMAKDKGWIDSPPDVDTFAKAVAKDANLLRRPIVITGKKAIVGFDKAAYAKLK